MWIASLLGLGFIFLMSCAGAALVFVLRGKDAGKSNALFLGFASGVMIAASIWSLLIPAMEAAEEMGRPPWLPASLGVILGALFLFALDRVIPHMHIGSNIVEGPKANARRSVLLFSAVTLHNIPEGMAVGLAFALAYQGESVAIAPAVALALGIGIQNFPEGAAIALPMAQEGHKRSRAFTLGLLSGAVEPVFGIITILVARSVQGLMPWLLSFAAGAMIYVVAEELIPDAHNAAHEHIGTFGVIAGFVIMMALDVGLG